jgi:beta-phosphoglucomutase-like phosphatase (HAD superfamily)
MDGLMIDSEPLAMEAWQATLRPFGHSIDGALFERMLAAANRVRVTAAGC